VLGAGCLLTGAARAQDRYREIYDDPVLFEQVSSAMQRLLIARFGPREVLDEKGNPIVPDLRGPTRTAYPSDSGLALTQSNGPVNDPTADATSQDTQSETALVLGSGSRVIAAFNDSGSYGPGSNRFTGWAYSSDGGLSWTDPGALPGNNDAGDPVLARDVLTGRTYLINLMLSGGGINCFRSDDDGASWMLPVDCAPTAEVADKPWMTVDNYPGPGNGNVYVVVRDFGAVNGILFYRSTDQGSLFLVTSLLATGSVQGANVVVTPNHFVHVFWHDANSSTRQIRTRKSSNMGGSWDAPVTVANLTSTVVNGGLQLPAGFRTNSFPQAAVNPVSGAIYVVFNDPTIGADHGNIFLCQSLDNGLTWSTKMQVNDDATTRAQYFPSVACRQDGMGLAVGWYDNRNDTLDIAIERWGSTASFAGGAIHFAPNFRMSPQFPPVNGLDQILNPLYMGDYDQMVADDTLYYTTWGDNRDDSLAVPTRKNANVRFMSFDQSGPGALLGLAGHVVSGGNGNLHIDQNECNDVVVTLENYGGQPATGISATLATTTPEVTIVNPTVAYADIPAGGSAGGLVPFRVSTSPSFDCNASVDLTLTVTHDTGTEAFAFSTSNGSDYMVTVGTDTIVPGVTDIGNHGDDVITTIPLPFPVYLYSSFYAQVVLSSNGNAQFTGASTAYSNSCLPTATLGDVICGHWDDMLTPRAGEGIYTSLTGVAPDRVFHIDFRGHLFSGGGPVRFELRLHEGSTDFELIYDTVSNNAASATIGIQGGGLSTSHACNAIGSVGPGTKLSFALPGCSAGGGPCASGPAISSVSPTHGPNTGLTGIVIHGSGFTGASAVSFGSNAAAFTVDSDTQITASLGATATTGHVDVTVTAGGTGTLIDGFDYFTPPDEVGAACWTRFLTWSGSPTLGEQYFVTTQNLGGASQQLFVDWSSLAPSGPHTRRSPPGPCRLRIFPDMVIDLGTTPTYAFSIPVDAALIGTHLQTQARILSPIATTQVLDATIGE